jgi:hypothetical protein
VRPAGRIHRWAAALTQMSPLSAHHRNFKKKKTPKWSARLHPRSSRWPAGAEAARAHPVLATAAHTHLAQGGGCPARRSRGGARPRVAHGSPSSRSACPARCGWGGTCPRATRDSRDGTRPHTACSGPHPTHSSRSTCMCVETRRDLLHGTYYDLLHHSGEARAIDKLYTSQLHDDEPPSVYFKCFRYMLNCFIWMLQK